MADQPRAHASAAELEFDELRANSLPLRLPVAGGTRDPVPARMVNEMLYCERLLYVEWAQGEWAENEFTVDGKFAHRRGGEPSGDLPPLEGGDGGRISLVRCGSLTNDWASPRRSTSWKEMATYRCEAAVYFAGSRRRVMIAIDEALVAATLAAIARATEIQDQRRDASDDLAQSSSRGRRAAARACCSRSRASASMRSTSTTDARR